ncbi:alpha/beta hydrolase fold-3 domain-containing protein [Trichoderma harzianum]|uniref:Alpha/beta hydrolase fold-3 domain-containing protein n=1 Tax=Trichoderma harzianum TaxID=5544 RepID=A0A0F9XRR0_TRIHA|nr:alpha/beta hydrolase fold-3 domain-containing protein [Trichoderma harzianum]
MAYTSEEEILALAKIDPEYESHLANVATGNSEAPINSNVEVGETLDIPMRDGYISQLRIHRPKDAADKPHGPVVVLMFGGGFQTGDNTQLSPLALAMTNLYDVSVINISYRLAPANKFPTGPNDAWDSLKWISANQERLRVDLDKGFVVGGISSGANLAAVCAQKWVDERLSPPMTGSLILIPMLLQPSIVPKQYEHLWLAREQNSQAPGFNMNDVNAAMAAYEPDEKSTDFSPFNAKNPHKGLPRTYISVCGLDPLRDDGLVYYHALEDNAVETRLNVYPGVPHAHIFLTHLQSAQKFVLDLVKAAGWLLDKEKSVEEIMAVLASK